MNNIFKYLISVVLYILIWQLKAIFLLTIGYLIVGITVMDRLPTLVFFGFLIAFYTSYLLVKKINTKPFFQRLYSRKKEINKSKLWARLFYSH